MLGLYTIFDLSSFNFQASLYTVTWQRVFWFLLMFPFPSCDLTKYSAVSTLLGDINILNSVSIAMNLFSWS